MPGTGNGGCRPCSMSTLRRTAILISRPRSWRAARNRSIALALSACEFFEIDDADARTMIRDMAVRISGTWKEALRETGVVGAQARAFEPAFEHDEAKLALRI